MLKGLALTPPVVGRISIGKVMERSGKRLPEKDDEFTITSQVQGREGWVGHPFDELLRKEPGAKLRCIPVRLWFDDPELSLRANYTMFERATGRPLCVGNGESCRRVTSSVVQVHPCPAPPSCPLAQGGGCRPYARLHVGVEVEGAAGEELGSFVLRTTGFNSIRTLSARLRYFAAVSGGVLSALPLALRLRGKSTTLSHRAPIYYVDLTLRANCTLAEAVSQARALAQARQAAGVDQAALDEAARAGLALGEFEESEEEGVAVVEEFYPEVGEDQGRGGEGRATGVRPGLGDRLKGKASGQQVSGNPPN